MESPFEILERHDDHAHSDATSHEKMGLLRRMQNLGPLLRLASGDWLEDSKLQTSVATSLDFGRFSSSTCWKKNGFCSAREDQEQAQQLARIQRDPPQRRLIFSPLALLLSHFEGCDHDTSAHCGLQQCDAATPPDTNKQTGQ